MAIMGYSTTDKSGESPSQPSKIPNSETDVLIVGSGPIGAIFARTLVDKGIKVLMIDVGAQETRLIGDHKKNSVAVQKNISLFTNTVKGELHPLSVPTNHNQVTLEPTSWCARGFDDFGQPNGPTVLNGQNPHQRARDNLPAAAATRVVGGMGSHWTCCTPRQHPKIERSTLFDDQEWDVLYGEVETMFKTTDKAFDRSIRQTLVKNTLTNSKDYEGRKLISMPLACRRSEENTDYVEWSCSATILKDLADPRNQNTDFEMRPNTQCIKLVVDKHRRIQSVIVKDLMSDKNYEITAKKYVLCAGAVLTPGILYNSDIWEDSLPALGHFLTEQPMAFCQVVLKKSLVDSVRQHPDAVAHRDRSPEDPLPFPFNDPDPQCYFPVSEEYPWHTQIHRDAFGYGEVPASIDQRVVVDLRWFGYVEPRRANCVMFTKETTDQFKMPQPTFHFAMGDEDLKRCEDMITDMVGVARHLGGFLPGSEPKYLPAGSALHICGTYRAGTGSMDSVVNKYGKVWGFDDLVLGGCGVIPTKNACNPTLTAGCFALAAAKELIKDLGK